MRSIFKKIAFVLALVMIVTMVPAQSASAASKPSVKAKRTLYIGGDTQEQYSNKGWASVKNKGDYTVKFASDNEDVVTVVERNGRLTAVAVGTANVTATFTKGKDVVKSTCVVTVKQNALSAGVTDENAKKLAALTVGETLTLTPTKTGLDSEEKTITVEDPDKKVFTSGIRFKSSNEEVFTVDAKTGELKAVKEGEAKLTVYGIQWEYDKDKKKWTTTKINGSETEYNVVVKIATPSVKEAKLVSVTKIELFVENVTDENLKDLKVMNEFGGDIKNIFKDPVLSEDKKVITLEKHVSLVNGEKLSFAFGDEKAAELTVVIGDADKIVLVGPSTVVANGEGAKIEYKVLDANGIELEGSLDKITFKTDDTTFSYVDNNEGKIFIYQVGKTVTLEASYSTGKFDSNWNIIQLTSNRIQVTGVDKAPVVAGTIQYKLGGNYGTSSVTMYENGGGSKLFTKVVLSDKREFTNEAEGSSFFSFETLDPSILLVDAATGMLYPVKAGTARILVKFDNTEAKITGVATVVVRSNQDVASVTVDKQMTTISNVAGVDKDFFNFTVKNQYGDKMDDKGIIKVEVINKPSDVTNDTALTYLTWIKDAKQASVQGQNQKSGNYTYRVWFSDKVSTVITVVVREPSIKDIAKASSYKFVAETSNNITVEADKVTDPANVTFKFKVVAQDNAGVSIGVVTNKLDSAVSVKCGNTTVDAVPDANGIYTANFSKVSVATGSAVTNGAVSAANKDDSIVINGLGYKIEEGTFTITGQYTKRNIIPTTVSVSVKKEAPTIKVKYAAIKDSTANTYENDIINALEVSDTNKYEVIALADVVNKPTQGGTSLVLVRKVKVAERVADGKYVIHTVDLNQYFTVNLQ